MWPGAVVVAKCLNASPYQMLSANLFGALWTAYTVCFAEHRDYEEDIDENASNP